jgi:DNA-binding NtrC family response regulator
MREMHPGVRCVLASGYLEPEVWSSMREEGISGFLQKPYELEALTAAIRGALPATADKK